MSYTYASKYSVYMRHCMHVNMSNFWQKTINHDVYTILIHNLHNIHHSCMAIDTSKLATVSCRSSCSWGLISVLSRYSTNGVRSFFSAARGRVRVHIYAHSAYICMGDRARWSGAAANNECAIISKIAKINVPNR